jgi:ketosteroid isomerase-like protein
MYRCHSVIFMALSLFVCACLGVAADPIDPKKPAAVKEPTPVKVVKEWIGHFPKKHVKLLPREAKQDIGVIVDTKTFAAVWSAWSELTEGTPPQVDFAKHFVLFQIRPAYVFYPAMTDFTIQDGVLKFKDKKTRVLPDGDAEKLPGVMVVLPRQGIRSFDTGNGAFELPGQPEPNAKETSAEVEKVYREYVNAAVSQDKKALERILAVEYTLIDDKGRHRNRTQLVEQLTGARIRLTSITPSDLKVRVYEKAAVVTVSCTEKGSVDHALFNVRTLYTVVFVSQDGRWRIVAEHATLASN